MGNTKLTFDFNRAVADARRDYPVETKGITFVDLSAQDAPELLTQWIKALSPKYKNRFITKEISVGDMVSHLMDKIGFAVRDPILRKSLVAISGTPADSFFMAPELANFSTHFIFNHELGHIVVPGGMPSLTNKKQKRNLEKLNQKAESIADSFAIIRGFKQKTMTKEEAKDIVQIRTLSIDATHDTSCAITALVENPGNINFKSLAPQEIKTLAAKHAKKYPLRIDNQFEF